MPYKRVDTAIEAARLAGVPLRIAGQGPEEVRLRRLAGTTPVEFLGWRSTEEVRELYRRSAVVLLPGVEDFGIAPVEAQACGTPVVAVDDGGARETVVEGTGMLVAPGAEAMADGIRQVLDADYDRSHIRRNAEHFSRAAFRAAFTAAVDEARSARS